MRRSIRIRLLVILTAFVIIPQLILGLTLGVQNINSQIQRAEILQYQIAGRESSQVYDFFQTVQTQLQTVADEPQLMNASVAQQHDILAVLMADQSAYDEVLLLDGKGTQLTHIIRTTDPDPQSTFETQIVQGPLAQNKVYFTPIHVDDVSGAPIITIAVPVDDANGKLTGAVIGNLKLSSVQDLIADDEPADALTGAHSTVYIVDSTNTVIAHNDPTIADKHLHFVPPTASGTQKGLDGENVFLAPDSFQLGDQKFTVIAETPLDEALSAAYSTLIFGIIVTAISLLLSVVVGTLVVNQIARPILALASTAHAVQSGDYSARAVVTGKDEIGTLAQAFNGMTTQLQQTLEGLKQHVDELEVAKVERERLIRELREASRLKSEFLSTMSHELRTPLNAMIGFAELMMAGVAGTLNEKQTHQLSRIHANSLRLLSLIDTVLDLSRIEAGRVDIAQAPFSPREMVNKIAAQTSSLAEKKGLQFLVSVDETLPETLLGDQNQIEHIVINLLSNAFKFTAHGEVELSLQPTTDNRWTLSVRDSGIGIPPHALEYIFEEFRQVDGTSRRMYGGSGLGLAICRNLARLMNGDVSVQSTLEQGSTFTLTLPLNEAVTNPVQTLSPVPEAV